MKRPFSPYPLWTPFAFLAPFLVVFAVFLVYPLLQSVILSLEQTFGPQHKTFVYFHNFSQLLQDPLFFKALMNTAIFSGASVLVQMPLSLGLALFLNRPDIRGRAFFRLIFFSPSLVGAVFVGVMFGIIFGKRTGLLNIVLNRLIGFNLDFPWLQEYVMVSLILASLWMWTGFNMIYFLAALQNVDKDLEEASKIDGAGPWDRFIHVTLPAIRPVAGFVVLLSIIGSFQLFELPYLLLNNSAGVENKGLTIVMYLYQTGFETGDLGYASAIGWILAIILIGLAIIQRRLSRTEGI
ncbi:sugar ABC transporter permease [Puniceicoccales bacterium CK1056]|uniref:Sugar ABC transporter permease n=1 Tax=Oceanipulchritudo coccoides TaxID=2706888 RepID=A0A6B2M5Y5_9BACT|nr:sugar ABC transporter permease [Oceanipulchritudo coccoides]NDV63090.1 sugar ABC transporter permease [Oceanipulchritudo coccoides]